MRSNTANPNTYAYQAQQLAEKSQQPSSFLDQFKKEENAMPRWFNLYQKTLYFIFLAALVLWTFPLSLLALIFFPVHTLLFAGALLYLTHKASKLFAELAWKALNAHSSFNSPQHQNIQDSQNDETKVKSLLNQAGSLGQLMLFMAELGALNTGAFAFKLGAVVAGSIAVIGLLGLLSLTPMTVLIFAAFSALCWMSGELVAKDSVAPSFSQTGQSGKPLLASSDQATGNRVHIIISSQEAAQLINVQVQQR
jgi:hypothetical protein